MRLKSHLTLIAAIVILGAHAALAQTASRPLSGYECKMLNITEQQSMDPNFHVAVHSGPSETSRVVGWAAAVVIVKTPAIAENGFLQMLFPNGRTVWIAASETKAYRPVSDPSARCQPEILANGRIGFGPG
jgi:hypothetical protein